MSSLTLNDIISVVNSSDIKNDILDTVYFDNSFSTDAEKRLLEMHLKKLVVVTVCSSAERCLKLIAKLRNLGIDSKIGKLFSRHMKLKDQVEYIQKSCPYISVGTPNRLNKIIQQAAFKKIDIIAIDSSRDAKERNILDINETRKDIISLLNLLKPNFQSQEARIVII